MSDTRGIRTIEGEGGSLAAYVSQHRAKLRDDLSTDGSVLFRGFAVQDLGAFDDTVRALSGPPLAYAERSSPRSPIQGHIYTSTDYPANEEIFFHNENSYQLSWPMTLYFHCLEPPHTLGATALSDIRTVHELIDPAVREEFSSRGWQLVRNFRDGLGLGWRDVFGTDDPGDADRYCAKNGIETRWLDDGTLRTTATRSAVHTHPSSGEPTWFNHATFFHVTSLEPEVRGTLRELFRDEELPANTFYGDGEPIPDDVLEHLRDCYRRASYRFDYQRGDVLVIDNMLTAHSREPFTGPRRIAVAMAEAYDSRGHGD
ncbi:TauD/TfdA family dioxygenase [Streptomyces griseofuscus]|uniref:TauD/TfdA family dioxygenase n=1 Tax=Streptomyces TaxID=1883 RepID=UPI0018F0D76F|nr:TauD/TfdA family dioxygenase [Streptomyces sp. CRPSP2-6A1]MBJ7002394.1 TauD/TfdA family dioxygenase [Streptomyces sp. CRPSP2-6A1]